MMVINHFTSLVAVDGAHKKLSLSLIIFVDYRLINVCFYVVIRTLILIYMYQQLAQNFL